MFRPKFLPLLLAAGLVLVAIMPPASAQTVSTPVPASQSDIANLTAQLASIDAKFVAYQQNTTTAFSALLALLTLMNGTLTSDHMNGGNISNAVASMATNVNSATMATSNATNRLESVASLVSQAVQTQQQTTAAQDARILALNQSLAEAVQNMVAIRESIALGLRDINTNMTIDHLRLYHGVYVPDPVDPNNRAKDRPAYVPVLEATHDVAQNQVNAFNASSHQHADIGAQVGGEFAKAHEAQKTDTELLASQNTAEKKASRWIGLGVLLLVLVVLAAAIFVFWPFIRTLKERAAGRGPEPEPEPELEPRRGVSAQELDAALHEARLSAPTDEMPRPAMASPSESRRAPAAPRQRPRFAAAAANAPRQKGGS